MKKRILKIVGYCLLGLLGLIVLLFILLQLPPVQSYLGNQAAKYYSKELQTEITIEKIRLNPLGGVTIKEIVVMDQKDRLLLSSRLLSGNVSISGLFSREVFISDIVIENTVANMVRQLEDSLMSHHFVLEYFTPSDTVPPARVWGFDLGTVELRNVDFTFTDEREKEFLTVITEHIFFDFETLGIEDKHIQVKDMALDNTDVFYQSGKTEYDEIKRSAAKATTGTTGETVMEPLEITVANADLNNVAFQFDNLDQEEITGMVDFNHLDIDDINSVIKDVKIKGFDIKADIRELGLHEKSGFVLEQFRSNIIINQEKIVAENLLIETPNSTVRDYFSMSYKSFDSFEHFLEEVIMNMDFDQATITLNDLSYFVPGFKGNELLQQQVDEISITGNFKGTLSDFIVNNMDLTVNKWNHFTGRIAALDIYDPEKMRITINANPLHANLDLIKSVLGPNTLPPELDPFSQIRYNGELVFTPNKLVATNSYLYLDDNIFEGQAVIENLQDFQNASFEVRIDRFSANNKLLNIVRDQIGPVRGDIENINSVVASGLVSGTMQDLKFNGMNIRLNNGEHLFRGDMHLRNTARPQQMYVNGNIAELKTHADFIASFFPREDVPEELTELGNITFSGSVEGGLSGLNTQGTLTTAKGTLQPDLYVNINTEEYRGTLSADEFDFSFLTPDTSGLGIATFTANIEGQGFDLENITSSGDLQVEQVEYGGYNYQNIVFTGNIDRQIISGELDINDPNLNLTFDGTVSLRDDIPVYNFIASVENANLMALGLSGMPMAVSGDLNFDFQGQNLDVMTGEGMIRNMVVVQEDETFRMDSMLITSRIDADTHKLMVQSDLLNASLIGDYQITKLPVAAENFIKDYYYERPYTPEETVAPQQARLELVIYKAADILTVLIPQLDQLNAGRLTANFDSGERVLDLESEFSSVGIMGVDVNNLDFIAAAKDDAIEYQIKTSRIDITDSIQVPRTEVTGSLANRLLTFDMEMPRDEERTRLHLAGNLALSSDTMRLQLDPGSIVINEEAWDINSGNAIVFGQDYLRIDNFRLSKGVQQLVVSSRLGAQNQNNLNVTLENIDVGDFSSLINFNGLEFNGALNGTVQARDIFNDPGIDADISMDHFAINKDTMGRFTLTVNKEIGQGAAEIAYTHFLDGERARVTGTVTPGEEAFGLDLTANLNRLPVKMAEPFTADFFTDLKGFASGNMTLEGTTQSPNMNGAIDLGDLELKPKLNQTRYLVSNTTINFNNSRFSFNEILLTDPNGHELMVNGEVAHENFRDFRVNASATTEMFQFLNTTARDNDFFYGQAFASGNVRISGRLGNPDIYVDATTQPGTEIFLPTVQSQQVMQYDFIQFYPLEEEVDPAYLASNVGFDVRLNLDITPDAKINVLMNPASDEKLTSTGRGNLYITTDETNEMELYGSYIVTEGQYVFALGNVLGVKREFDIQEGSRISWSGNPMEASIDATAIYHVEANTYNLVRDRAAGFSSGQAVAYQKKVPINVFLNISGGLYTPEIDFDIELAEDVGYVGNEVSRTISMLKQNENEMNKQVFSLITFNEFMPQDMGSYTFGGEGATDIFDATVSNFLSRQLSGLASEKLGIQVEIGLEEYQTTRYTEGTNQYSLQSNRRLEVALSKRLISDRMKITVGTGYDLQDNATGVARDNEVLDNSSVIISYELTPRGNLVVNAFTKSDYDIFREQNTYKTGVGISWSRAFDSLFGKDEEGPGVEEEEDAQE